MRKLVLALALALVLAGAGCTVCTVTTGATPGTQIDYTAHRFLWGWVSGDVAAAGQGIARVKVRQGVGDWFLTWLTLGLYCPLTVDVWTALPPAQNYAAAPLIATVVAPSAPAPALPPPVAQPAPARGSFCTGCGYHIDAGVHYCGGCGRDVMWK